MYPKYVEIDGKEYPINTDFRVAIECDRVARDETIGDYERALAIIYLLFGDKGIDDRDNYGKLLELAKKYLSCGVEVDSDNREEPDMDYIQDMPYIEASFMSDFGIDLEDKEMHWWKFNTLINGLSNSEMGNCCILNRIRNLRNYDASKIKDNKERRKIIESQKAVALKKNINLTDKQKQSVRQLMKDLGIKEG